MMISTYLSSMFRFVIFVTKSRLFYYYTFICIKVLKGRLAIINLEDIWHQSKPYVSKYLNCTLTHGMIINLFFDDFKFHIFFSKIGLVVSPRIQMMRSPKWSNHLFTSMFIYVFKHWIEIFFLSKKMSLYFFVIEKFILEFINKKNIFISQKINATSEMFRFWICYVFWSYFIIVSILFWMSNISIF